MKKNIVKLTALLIIAAALFVSCGKTETDSTGCFNDIDKAAEFAQKNNQDILVLITMSGDDDSSADFIEKVLNDSAFKSEVSGKYATIHMDFSQTSYEKTIVKEEDSKEVQKAAEDYANIMQRNTVLASMLNAQYTPSFFILSKEKYFISQLEYSEPVTTLSAFTSLINEKQDLINIAHEMIKATKTGSNKDRIAAIDRFYEETGVNYRPLISDLIDSVITLDKNNETGLVSKYILAKADAQSSSFFMVGDINGAVQNYLKICEDERLLPEHKQQAYYLAAYLLAMSSSDDYQSIFNYLKSAINVDPENEAVESIKAVLDYLTETFISMGVDVSSMD